MDELLASIREIIEENAGVSSSDNGYQAAENSGRSTKAEVHTQPRHVSNDSGTPHIKQDIRVAARNNGAPPVQDAMNALAERIGLRNGPASAPQESAPKPAAPQPQMHAQPQPQRMAVVRDSKPEAPRVAVRPQAPKQKRPPEARQENDEFDKGFRNDVERSAELLLRPVISQWLDEHFRQLFERILREEIQRFVQALRR